MRALVLVILGACVVPPEPYVRLRRLEPFDLSAIRLGVNPWFVDGPPTVFTAFNPLPRPVEVEVTCTGDPYEAHWVAQVSAQGEVRALGQLMNAVPVDACRVARYRYTDTPGTWVLTGGWF